MGGDERGEEREERGGEVKGEGRAQKGRGGERERGERMETGKRGNGRLQPTHTVTCTCCPTGDTAYIMR